MNEQFEFEEPILPRSSGRASMVEGVRLRMNACASGENKTNQIRVNFRFGPAVIKATRWRPGDKIQIRVSKDRKMILLARDAQKGFQLRTGGGSDRKTAVPTTMSTDIALSNFPEPLTGYFPTRFKEGVEVRHQITSDGNVLLFITEDA